MSTEEVYKWLKSLDNEHLQAVCDMCGQLMAYRYLEAIEAEKEQLKREAEQDRRNRRGRLPSKDVALTQRLSQFDIDLLKLMGVKYEN